MVAEAVKKAVRVRRNTRRRKRNQRTQRRRCTLKRELLEQIAIDVGVADGIAFDEVGGLCRDLDHRRGGARLERGSQRDGNRGAYVYVLHRGTEAGGGDSHVVWVERQIGELIMAATVALGLPFVSTDWILD